ncbi:MBL fold metallo-hydrolase [Paenibacillus sp. FSL H8-0548]|uniref:MBL fold metallo-hydrolase n=1 Tax=Paenibacillus sp. FSL H8-0548 TaxID=1920422 RepID=UPI00096DFCAD|nr:MBL fold metallo-hydrolase [Paenibacillus sp. FSL H8-0548]OMF38290.1 MBL fold metallo-hydrolase [Paenibacillus sp. FSL H8-0548]
MTRLIFRGTGDSMGVPRIYCDCEVCSESRAEGVNRRLRSSLQIEDQDAGTVWIDCGPDFGKQLEAASLRTLNTLLITHAHFDHIGGLAEWADACRWLNKQGIAYAPSEVISEIVERFPWLVRHIQFRPFDEPIMLGKWQTTSWRVNHGKNGYAYAFRFEHVETGCTWVYCSDSIGLTDEQQKPLADLDLLVLGTSFYHEPFAYETRSVYDVVEATDLIAKWKPKQTIFTHMSHDIDLRRNYALPDHLQFARTGMIVRL